MAVSSRAFDLPARKLRAERILDAAGELLLRWGYKRVTIDDVAAHAGIGKGTVYLHWPTREALFRGVLQRELAAAIDEIQSAIQADPEVALLHRLIPTWFVTVKRRPLVRAAILAELDVLGKLTKHIDEELECHVHGGFGEYLRLHAQHDLLRTDWSKDELFFALRATVRGFFLADVLGPLAEGVALERRAELLASILRRTFEQESAASPELIRAFAPHVLAVFAAMGEHFRSELSKAYAKEETP